MGISSDIPARPFQPLPATGVGSGIAVGQNPNIRGMANTARQNVSARQKRFVNMMEQSTGVPAENNMTATQQAAMIRNAAAPSEDYVKVGMVLVERRAEIDRFVDWTLFG